MKHRIHRPAYYNASDVLYRNIDAGHGDNTAIYWEDQRYSYAWVVETASRVGNSLRALEIPAGARVMMAVEDGPEFPAIFFGAIRAGYIPIPVNTVLPPGDYEYFLCDSQARAVIVSAPIYPKIAQIRKHCPELRHIIVVGGGGDTETLDFAAWIENAESTLDAVAGTPEDPAFWLYSSGSTGFPKGVVHRHRSIPFTVETYAKQVLNIRQDDIVFSASKAFHAYGLGNSVSFPAGVGAGAVFLTERPLPERVFACIDRFKPTVFFAAPTLYTAMLAVPGAADKYDMTTLRLCVSAAEALPPEVYKQWYERFGVEILDGIGSTEMLHIFISNRAGKVKAGSSGTPVPGYEAKIVRPDGEPVTPGETGDLLISGGSAAACYWNQPEKTARIMREQWMFTGDRYYQDADGDYFYEGRSDDIFKVSGQWISPIEVENILMEHPAVFECAVVAAKDAQQLQRTKAFVVLNQGHEGSEALSEALQAHVKSRLAPYKYPRLIEYTDELPKTVTGKIQRFKLRATPTETYNPLTDNIATLARKAEGLVMGKTELFTKGRRKFAHGADIMLPVGRVILELLGHEEKIRAVESLRFFEVSTHELEIWAATEAERLPSMDVQANLVMACTTDKGQSIHIAAYPSQIPITRHSGGGILLDDIKDALNAPEILNEYECLVKMNALDTSRLCAINPYFYLHVVIEIFSAATLYLKQHKLLPDTKLLLTGADDIVFPRQDDIAEGITLKFAIRRDKEKLTRSGAIIMPIEITYYDKQQNLKPYATPYIAYSPAGRFDHLEAAA